MCWKEKIPWQRAANGLRLIILIGNDFNSNSELQIAIRKQNDVVPCPKKGDVTHALSEAHWQHKPLYKSLHQSFFYSFITILPSESGITLHYSTILP
jgi:hypothetical protein